MPYARQHLIEVRLKMNKGKRTAHKKLINFRQKVLRRYKLLKGCAHCGYKKHFSALDFDHINRTTKIKKISRIVRDTGSFKKIKNEVRKCEVLCSNCHRIKTYENKDWQNKANSK
jgi:5-methylcytosine-specific restriction endonuclease McrA